MATTSRGTARDPAPVSSPDGGEEHRALLAVAERQVRERDLLDRVLTALARELDLPSLLRTVVEAIAATFGYTQVSLYRLEGGDGSPVLRLEHQVGYHRVLNRIPVERGVMGRVARTGRPVLIEDVREDPTFLGAIEGIVSEVCVPFHDEGRVAGVLNLESTGGVRLGPPDLRLLVALSQHVSVAVGRARLHDRIRAGEERLRLALDAAEMGTWEWHVPSGRVLWSDQMGPLYGLPAGTAGVSSEEWRALLHPEDRARLAEDDRRQVAAGGDYEIDFRVRRPDGEVRWLSGKGRTVERDGRGRAVRMVGVTMDVTARKRAEEERLALTRAEAARAEAEAARGRAAFLARAGELLAASLDTAATLASVARLAVPDLADWCVVDLVGPEGEVEQIAVAHADPAEEARLAEGRRRYPLDPDAPVGSGSVLRTGRAILAPVVTDAWLGTVAQDGDHRALLREVGLRSLVAVPLVARGGTLGVMSFNATVPGRYGPEDLELAEELARRAALAIDNARLYQEARAAVRARDRFLSIAAHELRTPLTVVKGYAELLQLLGTRGQLDPARLRRPLDQIAGASARLVGLMDDLLDVSRIRLGQLPLRPRPVDLATLIRTVRGRLGDGALGDHTIALDLPPAPLTAEADGDRLEQVLGNLLDNAIKYSPGGGPIGMALRPEGGGVLIEVADRGIGLPRGAEEAIFEPFGRAANTETTGIPGLGLGLYICRNVVERHGGRIWAESAGEGLGTTVRVWLPLVARPDAEDAA